MVSDILCSGACGLAIQRSQTRWVPGIAFVVFDAFSYISGAKTASMEETYAKTIAFAYGFRPFLLWRLWSGDTALSNPMGARYRFGCV